MHTATQVCGNLTALVAACACMHAVVGWWYAHYAAGSSAASAFNTPSISLQCTGSGNLLEAIRVVGVPSRHDHDAS